MRKTKTHEEFLEELTRGNSYYSNGEFEVVGRYISTNTKIQVRNEYGLCKMTPSSLAGKGSNLSILTAVDPTQYFKNQLSKCNEDYIRGKFVVTGEYINTRVKIEIEDKYGTLKVLPQSLINNNKATIISATNPTDYFKNKLFEKNEYYRRGEFIILGEYTSASTNIHLKCRYGECNMIPNVLLRGANLTINAALDKTSYWINMAKEVHGDSYDYSKVSYINNFKKVTIICPLHGEFKQLPGNHLMAKGCATCGLHLISKSKKSNPTGWNKTNWFNAAQKAKKFYSYKVYLIECWDEETGERFIKIGRTFQEIKRRFVSNNDMPYQYKVLKVVERKNKNSYEDMEYIYDLESRFKRMYKRYKYLPNKEFGGWQECFKIKHM